MAELLAPRTETEAADLVRGAAAASQTLEILSAGSKRGLGRPMKTDAVLSVGALNGVIKYEPHELVVTAQAATPVADIEALLAARGQMLGFAPADWGPLLGARMNVGTLGGLIATNASGARRVKAGNVRDHLIGCRFVNGQGEVVKAGGQVVKNVTGFDIPKLMCGAFGTLGVLTEVTFRTVPKPERAATIALRGGSVMEALSALRQAAALPLEATGLSYLPRACLPVSQAGFAGAHGLALIRVEGAQEAITEKLERLTRIFAALDPVDLSDDMGAALFRAVGEGTFLALTGLELWRVHVASSDAAAIIAALAPNLWQADCAGALLWLALPPDDMIRARLQGAVARVNGHAVLMRGAPAARATLPVFPVQDASRARLTQAVKNAFDPKRILNPGRMYEGI